MAAMIFFFPFYSDDVQHYHINCRALHKTSNNYLSKLDLFILIQQLSRGVIISCSSALHKMNKYILDIFRRIVSFWKFQIPLSKSVSQLSVMQYLLLQKFN